MRKDSLTAMEREVSLAALHPQGFSRRWIHTSTHGVRNALPQRIRKDQAQAACSPATNTARTFCPRRYVRAALTTIHP
jgi:hypothetical protein